MSNSNDNQGRLKNLIGNCIFAYDELCRVNRELREELDKIRRNDFGSGVDFQHLGAMNRMIQDYLIIRVHGLFDKTEHMAKGGVDEVVSFEKVFSENKLYEDAKEQDIIKYIADKRHNFVAHTNINSEDIVSSEICDSNLKEILVGLKTLVDQ